MTRTLQSAANTRTSQEMTMPIGETYTPVGMSANALRGAR